MVIQRLRMATRRTRRKTRRTAPGSAGCADFGFARNATPRSGMKMTATSQDARTAMLTTAKIEKVYSPAELLAKPIGTKPAMVTSDPVSIGKARVPIGEGRRRLLFVPLRQPHGHGVDGAHGVIDQQRQRDDERAQRDALQIDAHKRHDRKYH